MPASSSLRSRSADTSKPTRSTHSMARHGPIAGAGGDHPGVRPSRLTRAQRNCACSTIGARQRGRGRRCASRASSDAKRISSSFSPSTSSGTTQSCATCMLSLASKATPLSHTLHSPASPPNARLRRTAFSVGGASKTARNHQSSASKRLGGPSNDQRPTRRNAPATVSGASIGCQAGSVAFASWAGVSIAPAGVAQSVQRAFSGARRWFETPRIRSVMNLLGCGLWRPRRRGSNRHLRTRCA